MCERCNVRPKHERHDPQGLDCATGAYFLCHFCHMIEDGRLVMMARARQDEFKKKLKEIESRRGGRYITLGAVA